MIFSQGSDDIQLPLRWSHTHLNEGPMKLEAYGIYNEKLPEVDAVYFTQPYFNREIQQAELVVVSSQIISVPDSIALRLSDSFTYDISVIEVRNQYELQLFLNPIRKVNNNQAEVITKFSINFNYDIPFPIQSRNPEATFQSVLASGDVYKIKVSQTGLYKITKTFLENALGININTVNPKKIKIFGNRGGRIPEANNIPRQDDLKQLSIYVAGEADGKFDAGDYILFYAEGADLWSYNYDMQSYNFDKNIYDDFNYYFIKIDSEDGLRIEKPAEITGSPDFITSVYEKLQRWEEDKTNLLGSFNATEGTGKDWYGDIFNSVKEKKYTSSFNFSDLEMDSTIHLTMAFAARGKNSSSVTIKTGDKSFSKNISSVNTINFESLYARRVAFNEKFKLNTVTPEITLSFPQASIDNTGWLDYIQYVSKHRLNTSSTLQFAFRNSESQPYNIAAFEISDIKDGTIWEITDPFNPKLSTLTGNLLKFLPEKQNKEFLFHHLDKGAYEPTAVGKVPAQNLHAMLDEDMIIVYHPDFKTEAQRLAGFRNQQSGLRVLLASTEEIYNEFGGGKADPGAIRDMARLLLFRNPAFKFLLLMGDGSYDYKGTDKNLSYENYIPVYETDESLDPINGFPSDDFYGLLGENEGADLRGGLDIYIGRLPVRNVSEAKTIVDKIIHYETNPATLGDWRTRTGFVCDDEDGNTHIRDTDDIARKDESRHPLYTQQKIYIDAYKQVSTSGEKRYPDANKAINNNIFKGLLSMTYLGHGGPLGWAQERILTIPDIESWTNADNLTLFITATCSFGAYDNPSKLSPAEYAILNPKGGAIALMTTTRAVYTNTNKLLTDATHENLLDKVQGERPTLGYIMTEGKNKYQSDNSFRVNSRKFVLLGDPSMPLALPKYNIVTEKINGSDAALATDTMAALQKVQLSGYIAGSDNAILSDFNGTLYITVYDKKSSLRTLSNDGNTSSVFPFTMYKNILFKGSATVNNGRWTVSFRIPKNIDYNYGYGRITYYAHDGQSRDASGNYDKIIIGGSSSDLLTDNQPPQLSAYMNDVSFVHGGITNSSPVLLLHLSDDLGINVTGNAIGQDITAILDGDNRNILILNDFYEAQKDDYTSGIVRYPLSKLSAGSHYITTKAWDISGNSAETRIDFIVADLNDNKLKRVLNYPNPFTSHTQIQFDHNLPNTELDIVVNIYTITGKLVKSITETKYSTGFRVNDIVWNGKDDFEGDLARGIYLYKVLIHSKELNITKESNFEKLIKL
ncbi:MAG TPA: type IX secretion system sortase PorU [Saprospiraceae bacterium]|nr:type IX secretion system sortase PorU [Saprospiraceae bacterium]HRO07429.1 type IX secretion system sortase PorU [Saprospiraceae bacterium]HRP40712.1 type IX secretion system sortase PorU [Saprospiraceae bacterium]